MNCFIRAVKWKILIHIRAEKYFVWVGGKWPLCSTCTSISGSQLFGHLTISLVICRWITTSTPIAPSGITLRGVWWATGPPRAANSWTPIRRTPPAPATTSPTSPSSWRTVKSQYVTSTSLIQLAWMSQCVHFSFLYLFEVISKCNISFIWKDHSTLSLKSGWRRNLPVEPQTTEKNSLNSTQTSSYLVNISTSIVPSVWAEN